MRTLFVPVGPRGLALLASAGLVGLVLAGHGWSHRDAGGAPGSLANGSGAARGTSAPASAPSKAGPTHPSGVPIAASGAPGPLLASQPFAAYSFVVWPGAPSVAGKAALTGLSVSVHRQASGLSITAGVNGQQAGTAHFYPKGARVYVVEASMGDDSGNADYNLGDDGIVVTDSQGRIIQ